MAVDPAVLSLVSALRTPEDEVRFNVTLAAVCTMEPANGSALARAALASAAQDPNARGRARRLLPLVPDQLRCRDQLTTSRLTVGRARKAANQGVIDLILRDLDGFALACELKIGRRRYHEGQLARYLQTGLPVVGLVRERSSLPEFVVRDDGWLGEALWSDLTPVMADFSLPDEAKRLWLVLLEVLKRDQDLVLQQVNDRQRPNDADSRAVLREVRDRVGLPAGAPEWDEQNELWLLGFPNNEDPYGVVALSITDAMPYVVVVAGDLEERALAELRKYGVDVEGRDAFVEVGLSLAEQSDPAARVPSLVTEIVDRFVRAGAWPTSSRTTEDPSSPGVGAPE